MNIRSILAICLALPILAPVAHAANRIEECPEMHGKYNVLGKPNDILHIEQGARHDRRIYVFGNDEYMVDDDQHVKEDGEVYSTQCKADSLAITSTRNGKLTVTTYALSKESNVDLVRTVMQKGSKAVPRPVRFELDARPALPPHDPSKCLVFAQHTFEYQGRDRYELVENEYGDTEATLRPVRDDDYHMFFATRIPNGVSTNVSGDRIIDGTKRRGDRGEYKGVCNGGEIYIHNLDDGTVYNYAISRSGVEPARLLWWNSKFEYADPTPYKAVEQ